jgi:STE24 endopeptidase
MDERMIRKYFLASFAFRLFSIVLVGLGMVAGIAYMFFHVPMFLNNDYFQVASVILIIVLAFLVSVVVLAPFEYRLDKKYGRVTLSYGSYFGYKMRSRLVFLIPFSILFLIFILYSAFMPNEDVYSIPFTYLTTLVAIFIIGIIMPRIYGSLLRKERIGNPELSKSIQDLASRMGIKGRIEGAYQVPVRGFKVVNAAQLGFGRRHGRIYLIGDIEELLNKNEVEAVVAHEFAHMKCRHILKLSVILVALMIGMYTLFTVLSYTVLYSLLLMGADISGELILVSIILLDYVAPFMLVYLVILKFRRAFEFEADKIAAQSTSPKSLANSLLKLADYNLLPKKFPRILGGLMSHPSMSDRTERLQRIK